MLKLFGRLPEDDLNGMINRRLPLQKAFTNALLTFTTDHEKLTLNTSRSLRSDQMRSTSRVHYLILASISLIASFGPLVFMGINSLLSLVW